MRKTITIIAALLLLFTTSQVQAQDFRDKVNIIAYGSYGCERLNTNTHSNDQGVFANLNIINNKGISVGPFITAAWSNTTQNLSSYEGKSQEFGAGIAAGYYSNDIFGQEFWGGLSCGILFGKNDGTVILKNGTYASQQKDQVISTSLGLNFWHSNIYDLLPRTQIQVVYQVPLANTREAYWNKEKLQNDPSWDRTYLEISVKESLINLKLSGMYYIAPKIVAGYSYMKGNNEETASVGSEISVFKQGKGDGISIFGLYEIKENKDNNRFRVGIMLSFTSLF
jgi:hypothetical protein